MTVLVDIRATALRFLIPPPRLRLSEWIETNIRLPEGTSALPGPVRLWAYQREIADAISDPKVERVTLVKPVRVGFTTLLTGAIGHFVANDPAPILCLLPTESDSRDYMVSDIEPIFAATPALADVLTDDTTEGRNTLLHRRFPGGSLKIVAAKAPRNLRRHTARILLVDEADACEIGAEGNPIRLGERRTMSFANRKIIIVESTPLFEDTSAVLRAYAESDGRVFEVPCPSCGTCTEIMWAHIEWEPGRPDTAAFRCPHCAGLIAERHKAAMVAAGAWRATRPDVIGHAGFRLNALVSLLANASWSKLATEFLAAKEDPAELMVFTNTILAEGWREAASEIDELALASRVEPFDLDNVPAEVLVVTIGADVQDDRIEATVVGWTRSGEALVLAHFVIWGSFQDETTWAEFDETLRTKWKHPYGGQLKVSACCIDAGDGDHYDSVLSFAAPRIKFRTFAIKGVGGSRPGFALAKGGKVGGRLGIVGVDVLKTVIFDRLQRGRSIRFSHTLELAYFEQLAAERRIVRYRKGRPVRRFERVSQRARAEALDALVYAFGAKQALPNINWDRREAELRGTAERRSIASRLAR